MCICRAVSVNNLNNLINLVRMRHSTNHSLLLADIRLHQIDDTAPIDFDTNTMYLLQHIGTVRYFEML